MSLLATARALSARSSSGLFFLDASKGDGPGRRSYLMCDPSRWIEESDGVVWLRPANVRIEDPVAFLRREAHRDRPYRDGFSSGWCGMLSFEFAWALDVINAVQPNAATPTIWAGEYSGALVFDHDTQVTQWTGDTPPTWHEDVARTEVSGTFEPQIPRAAYEAGVSACVDAIGRGDVFEVNYTSRFSGALQGSAFGLYEAMRDRSSGDYFGFLQTENFAVASVSPEQFVSVRGDFVVTRPIKGTRPSLDDPVADREIAEELLGSAKDRAENVMIVDLMRNDLTKVCELGSVRATAICELETFAGLHHLVSTVEGTLAATIEPVDVLLACFPAGSITGAPKLRAVELITELESSPRGAYTGSFFLIDRGGYLDSNVLIRTATVANGRAEYGAGGAVVWDSNPWEEYAEALVKARAFLGVGDA